MAGESIIPRHDLSLAEIQAAEDRLYEFNAAATGSSDGQGLAFVAHDEDGEMIGVVAGYTWAGITEIKQMWLREDVRGRGLGRRLMLAALDEATARGCQMAWVMSYEFQAPAFYEKLGFERAATLEDWPIGRRHVVLKKHLVTP